MKELKELKGVKLLTKKEQKSVVGGYACINGTTCPPNSYCCYGDELYKLCRRIGDPCF
jgi:hypothetical protein